VHYELPHLPARIEQRQRDVSRVPVEAEHLLAGSQRKRFVWVLRR
jgi:hypothetical protein